MDNRYAEVCITPNSSDNAKKIITQNTNAEGLVFNMLKF